MTPEVTFARTRIQPPRVRNDLINRPSLEAGLQQAMSDQRLTLIVAPAGWGKTQALARQLGRLPAQTIAWVTADVDDDLPRFLAGLAAALTPFDLPWRVSPAALATLLQSERSTRAVADEIVNALAESELQRGLLVIDDVHRWSDPRLFELLAALIEHLPTHWGVVLSSRTEPPLPVARWRARGELAEFRQGKLRFDLGEVRELLQSRGLATDRAEDLLRRTEGWAAGLRLMLSVGAGAGQLSGRSQRDVFDYLAAEVLDDMTPDMRQFLLRCSVLPELTAERCAHVSGMPSAAGLFAQLQRDGLFVTALDESGETLRLHDLFRDFLEEKLQRDSPRELPELLCRAAEREPNLLRAVTWLLRAGVVERAGAELAARGPALLRVGGQADLTRMLALLPAGTVEGHPDLAFLRGLCNFQVFDFEPMVAAMDLAERGYSAAGQIDKALLASIMKHAALMNCGRVAEARVGFEQIRQRHPAAPLAAMLCYFLAYLADMEMRVDDVTPALRDLTAHLEAAPEAPAWEDLVFFCVLALYPDAPAIFERHVRIASTRRDLGVGALRIAIHHVRATLAFGCGQLAQAREALRNADEDLDWLGRPLSLQEENNALHGFIDALSGDVVAARQAAERSVATLRRSWPAYQRVHSDSSLSHALRTYWLLGDAQSVRRLRDELHAAADPWEWGTAPTVRALADGMVALLDEQWEAAERCLLGAARRNRWTNFCLGMVAQVLGAEAQRRRGDLDAAAETLRELLDDPHLPQSAGCALLAGAMVIRNLARTQWGKRLSLAAQGELDRWLALISGSAPTPNDIVSILPASLTAREAEVLDLIAKGHSNKLIARDMSLSLFTVKRHVANILGKTELTSRTELAAWWIGKRRSSRDSA